MADLEELINNSSRLPGFTSTVCCHLVSSLLLSYVLLGLKTLCCRQDTACCLFGHFVLLLLLPLCESSCCVVTVVPVIVLFVAMALGSSVSLKDSSPPILDIPRGPSKNQDLCWSIEQPHASLPDP